MIFGMTVPNVTQLQHKLRKGFSPEDLELTELEQGAQKTAYLVMFTRKSYVVKLNTGGWHNPNQKCCPKLPGCDAIYQLKAGKWMIQEYVTPLQMRNGARKQLVDDSHPAWKILDRIMRTQRGDYHPANFGIREDGTLVCFDW